MLNIVLYFCSYRVHPVYMATPAKLDLPNDPTAQWEAIPERCRVIVSLLAVGHTNSEIARSLKVSPPRISQLITQYQLRELVSSLSPQDIKRLRLQAWTRAESRPMGHVTEEKLKESSARDLYVMAGISADKISKIEGEIAEQTNVEQVGLDNLQRVYEVPPDDVREENANESTPPADQVRPPRPLLPSNNDASDS
jgi:hypothetical protein